MTSEIPENTNNQPQEESFDTTGLLLAYLANWKWFVLSAIVCLIGAYFFVASKVPVYQVDASLYLNDEHNSQSNTFSINSADPMVALKNYIDATELEVLKSRNNLVNIVDSLDLSYTYALKGRLRNIPLYKNNPIRACFDKAENLNALIAPVEIKVSGHGDNTFDIEATTKLESDKIERKLSDVQLPCTVEMPIGNVTISANSTGEGFDGTEYITIVNPYAAAGRISAAFNISFAKDTDRILRLSLTDTNIERAVDIINVLVEFYNRDIIEEKNRSAVQTEAFILDRLVMISGELKDVENRLQQYRQAHNVTDIQSQSTLNLSLKSGYEKELAEIDAELNIVDEIQRIVSSAGTFETLPTAMDDPVTVRSIEEYNKKVVQLNRTLEGSTPDNPLVKNLQEELSRDKNRIVQTLAVARRNLSTRRASLRSLESQSQGVLASTPTVDKGLQEIFREQQVKVNIYTFLLQRREEIALQKTLATNTARLIDDPTSIGKVSPKTMMIMLMALILGLGIPAAIIFIRRMLFPIFSDQEELERITTVPVLGEICQSDKKDGEPVVVGANVTTPIAELFRLLRNNISFTRSGVDSKVILITSSISGEGKTFVASNLAMTYALMGKKVIVIGMDLRRPMLAHSFGLTNARGVTTYLSGQESNIDSLITQSKVNPNLYILPAGPVPPNPNELLMSGKMSQLMSTLRQEYDYVIIDSAPVGVISDTFLITRLSDLQIYVTRANYSTKSSLKVLHQAVRSGKFSSVYIVLNGVNITSNSYLYRRYGEYGHYGRRAHAYGYGYGGADKSKEASSEK